MRNKKMATIISVIIVGVMLLSTVGFATLIGLPQNNTQNNQLSEENIKIDNGIQDEDDMFVEENEVGENFENKLFKTDMQGSVSVGVTFLNPIEEDNDYFNFGVALNTHSVDLDGYDLGQMAVLYLGDDVEIKENMQWTMVEGGGHHVSGMLKVAREQEGEKFNYFDKEHIRLEIKGIDNVESRAFEWERELF